MEVKTQQVKKMVGGKRFRNRLESTGVPVIPAKKSSPNVTKIFTNVTKVVTESAQAKNCSSGHTRARVRRFPRRRTRCKLK